MILQKIFTVCSMMLQKIFTVCSIMLQKMRNRYLKVKKYYNKWKKNLYVNIVIILLKQKQI